MNVLGIIPARGGSKRILNKNIKLLDGIPLIGHTINIAKQSDFLVDCLVSTDSDIIAETASKLGGKVPFLRPADMAEDDTGDRPFLIHALNWYEANNDIIIDAVCLLRPTSPFRTADLIEAGIKLLISSKSDSVRSMTKVNGVHHPYWMFREEEGLAKNLIDGVSIEKYYQSQLLPMAYRLNGCVDLITAKCLRDENSPLYGHNMKILETSEKEGLDIDTPEDFEYCEWLMTK